MHPLSGGVMAAIVSAVIVAVVLLGVVVLCIRQWRKRRRAQLHVLPPRARVPADTTTTLPPSPPSAGEASAPRRRYMSSSMDFDLPRSRDDIDIHWSSFRV
ncbi:hypothetical protein QYE76_031838 [Lolium multiflorum]|uniref:Uncharacterized protein n=1 Tax=Lolium multiflorum TaxID=4521 RepID=A0AAD8VKJ7_LOLMU|nr:hypothetical protein QYE76_031838 [Lolium multiflorum]